MAAVQARYESLSRAFDEIAERQPSVRRPSRGYHSLIRAVHESIVRPGASVLEIGSGAGDLLAALEPSEGLGVDVSAKMVELARERHPDLRFENVAGEDLDTGETFDYVVLSDLVPYVDDLLALFRSVAAHSHRDTRVVIHSYSQLLAAAPGAARAAAAEDADTGPELARRSPTSRTCSS